MATTNVSEQITLPQRDFSPLAGLLSYLVPGLGQMVQGRIGKGLLFFFSLYGLFFFGEYLGDWRNVYIYDSSSAQRQAPNGRGRLLEAVADRARFFAQFWVGMAAWPAVVQHFTYNADLPHPLFGNYQRRPTETELNDQIRNSDKSQDVGWMYTVIAGVLNILVIYDALAGPAYVSHPSPSAKRKEPAVI
jgi:Family of unknown function (DUF6677)